MAEKVDMKHKNCNDNSKYHVAVFGAYDLYSLGDTMFPVLTEKELKARFGNSVTCDFYSPHSLEHPYNNLPSIFSIDDLPKKNFEEPYDMLIIGGGEFIHFAEIDYLSPDGVPKKYEQAELWEKPQKIANELQIPVVWNCVGVSYDITEPSQTARIRVVAENLCYLSVRDLYSKIRLENLCGISNVKQVGDMLWLFNRHYTKEFLERQRKEISTTNDFLNSDYIVLQYGTSYKYEELAKKVLAVSEKFKLNVVLLTVNYCHEDDATLKKMKSICPSFYTLDKILQPVEIMSVIAGAKFFMGTSLHGNIVAMSYGVPNLCLDMYPSFVSKMDGLFEMMSKFDLVIDDFSDLENKFASVYSSYEKEYFQAKISRIQSDLDKHFDNMSDVIRKVNSFPVSLSEKQDSSVCSLLEREHEKYSATVKRLESMSEKLSTELSNKTGHIEQLMQSERDLKNELNGKDAEIARKDEEINKRNAELESVSIELSNKTGHVEQLLQSERELKGVINKMEQRMDDDKKIISELTAQIEQLNCEISALYNSQSWKITAPLRFMKSIIRKIYTILFPCRLYNVIRIFRRYGIVGVIKKIVQKIRERQCRKLSAIYNPTLVNSSSYDTISIPVFDDIRVSIIIPVYNQFDYTYKCISSIVNTVKNITYEIIIGDDMSTDETKRITEFFPNVRVNKNESDHGFLMNCNRAANLAKGKYILFLNNDTQVQEDWLSSLVSLIESDEKIGMVGSKLVYPDGTLQEAGGIIWSDASGWNYGRGNNATLPEYNYVKEVDYISGASIMIRSSLWNAIGGFDERYKPAYYEDSDLAFEVRKHGFKVMYQPKSVVVHFEGISNGTDLTSGLKKYQVENREKFVAKWADELKGQCPPEPEKYLFRARDRSFGKKSILVVDHYVPNFDKDAGGRCTYMYMKIFQKLGMKVSFIGDNFAKIEPYASILTQGGIEFLCGNWYCIHWKEWLKDNLKNFDFVYLQRPHIAIKYIDLVKENCDAKVFYFAHDLHHIRLYREYKVSGDEKKLSESEHWKKIEMELFEKSDVGHVVGSYEQKIMQERMPEKPIRNIPLYIYESQLENVEKDFSKRSGLVFVGGFNHTPNKDAVLWFINEIYPQILKEYPDMVFHIVGSNTPDEIKKLQSKNIKVEGFLSDADLHSLYQSCRLAVVPLRYGAGVKGKIVEAAYNQIPLVTTSIGGEGIDSSVGAFLMEDDAGKMAELICSLYKDFEKLRHMSDSGKQLIEKCFTEKTAQAVLLQDLE